MGCCESNNEYIVHLSEFEREKLENFYRDLCNMGRSMEGDPIKSSSLKLRLDPLKYIPIGMFNLMKQQSIGQKLEKYSFINLFENLLTFNKMTSVGLFRSTSKIGIMANCCFNPLLEKNLLNIEVTLSPAIKFLEVKLSKINKRIY